MKKPAQFWVKINMPMKGSPVETSIPPKDTSAPEPGKLSGSKFPAASVVVENSTSSSTPSPSVSRNTVAPLTRPSTTSAVAPEIVTVNRDVVHTRVFRSDTGHGDCAEQPR